MIVPLPPGPEQKTWSDITGRGTASPRVHSPADRLSEAVGLAEAINLDVVEALTIPLARYRPSTLLGKGKVEELAERIQSDEITLVIIDHPLTPVQQRNLEKALNAKVLDRTGLILEIFGARARTREGVLQVELAHLEYQRSRLVRSWTHLERQRGGAGFLGGPGESQLELDRRILQARIDKIREELEVVVRMRELHRAGRRRVPYPVVALVGYTNAGKSSLFNRLSGAGVLAEDQVFATLDPTMREIRLPSRRRVIISDTVGFISDLPTMLVAAFRATLEEVTSADLILHVRDISHPETNAQCADVERILHDLGMETGPDAKNLLEIWNKVDLLDAEATDRVRHDARRSQRETILVSALTGEGIVGLLHAVDSHLGTGEQNVRISLPPQAGAMLHWLYENTDVLDRRSDEMGNQILSLRLSPANRERLIARLATAGLGPDALEPIAPHALDDDTDQSSRSTPFASSQKRSISSSDD